MIKYPVRGDVDTHLIYGADGELLIKCANPAHTNKVIKCLNAMHDLNPAMEDTEEIESDLLRDWFAKYTKFFSY